MLLVATPVIAVHAEILATPVAETPTPTATPEPTAVVETPSAASTPEPPAEIPATPGPTESLISPMSVNPGGSLTDCSQNPSNGNITSTRDSIISCKVIVASYGGDNADQRGRITRPALPSGFSASIVVSGVSGGSQTMGEGSTAASMAFVFNHGSGGYRTATVTITLKVASSVSAGTSFNRTFTACHATINGAACHATSPQNGSAIVTAQVPNAAVVPLVEGVDYSFACGPAVSAGYLGKVESTCTMTINNSAILLDGLRIAQVISSVSGPAGWTISLRHNTSGALLANVPGTYSVPSSITLHPLTNPTWSFKVHFENTGCPTNQVTNVNLSLAVRRMLLVVPGPTQYLAGKNIAASVNLPPQASLSSVTATSASTTYSMTNERTASSNLVMRYSVTGCGSWHSSARVGKFVDPANPNRTTVPTLTGATQVSTTQNPPGSVTVSVPVLSTIAETDTRIATGTSPGPNPVVVTQTIQLNYRIPANTPVSTYQATVTVTTASGP